MMNKGVTYIVQESGMERIAKHVSAAVFANVRALEQHVAFHRTLLRPRHRFVCLTYKSAKIMSSVDVKVICCMRTRKNTHP